MVTMLESDLTFAVTLTEDAIKVRRQKLEIKAQAEAKLL
jgi:hypothetical protein